LKFIAWQGFNDTLQTCTVCHASTPQGDGPHGTAPAPVLDKHAYLPVAVSD
jgi:hypothetical protein